MLAVSFSFILKYIEADPNVLVLQEDMYVLEFPLFYKILGFKVESVGEEERLNF